MSCDESTFPKDMLLLVGDYFMNVDKKGELIVDSLIHSNRILFVYSNIPHCTRCLNKLDVIEKNKEYINPLYMGYCSGDGCNLKWQICYIGEDFTPIRKEKFGQ